MQLESLMLGLKEEDQKALDWIMQCRSDGSLLDHAAWALAASEIDDRRLRSIGCLLDLLGECATYEPPENLAGRTLGRIEAHRAMLVSPPASNCPMNEPLET
jgi:hypothetical protein